MGKLTNLNPPAPIAETDLPASIARDTEYRAADVAHVTEPDPHPQYLPANPLGIEFGQGTFNALDFHTALPAKDFDARLLVSGGGTTNGLATLLWQAALFSISAKVAINGGAQIAKLLSVLTNVELPLISANAVFELSITVNPAAIGDIAFFAPTEMPAGLQFFKITALATAGVVKIYFHNLSSSALDLPAFSGRLLIIGF